MHTANITDVNKVFVYMCECLYEYMYTVYRKRTYSFDV